MAIATPKTVNNLLLITENLQPLTIGYWRLFLLLTANCQQPQE
ncbi:MAG: hypothetical protein RMY62_002905 [Nostoc sp. ZfuVER08]